MSIDEYGSGCCYFRDKLRQGVLSSLPGAAVFSSVSWGQKLTYRAPNNVVFSHGSLVVVTFFLLDILSVSIEYVTEHAEI